jgi:hypothetical protein
MAINTQPRNEIQIFPQCDVCPAQSYYRAQLTSGDLFFCRHHFNKYESKLIDISVEIYENIEQLRRLNKNDYSL